MWLDYSEKIRRYTTIKPTLRPKDIGVLLTIDTLYEEPPEDLALFRQIYLTMDPTVSSEDHRGVTFLKLAACMDPTPTIKRKLNGDLNVKFNDIVHARDYRTNQRTFERYSLIASTVIEEILKRARLPREVTAALREREASRSCTDYYRMLALYRAADDRRLRFELLRKLGLIVLIARINRCIEIEALDESLRNVRKALVKGLGVTGTMRQVFLVELDAEGGLEVRPKKLQKDDPPGKDVGRSRTRPAPAPAAERIVCNSFTTAAGTEIVHIELRNKLKPAGVVSYTSYVEKMIRKNLEYPNQVGDTIGVKIVVGRQRDIPRVLGELESFLGGSLSRKKEKDVYTAYRNLPRRNRIPTEYYVWKAVYDIPLPHPSISLVKKMMRLAEGERHVHEALKKTLSYYLDNPLDFVIEIQLQEIHSYLISKMRDSPTAHGRLKATQIRSNSFYKLFPKEIYETDIQAIKARLLRRGPAPS